MKRITVTGLPALLAAALLAAGSCAKLDVVGRDSVVSFQAMLEKIPGGAEADGAAGGWALTAPDRSARFIWSRNYQESPLYDAMIVFDARPFIEAGLDPARLPENILVIGGNIVVGTKLGDEVLSYKGEATPVASFEQIVNLKRDSINYHGALDHYGVNLSGGNLFEWAKDMGKNDKDIVFVLNPGPFIAAGADPAKIEGWVFAKVPVDDENGRPAEADKILKPFDL
ncbi:MAG: hypothetical protein LBI91_07680 [Spirochaetaceae bacterium]|jgi:hypothetical protein|nr:hypothetical protein [Spirochaetaceae bacterium]